MNYLRISRPFLFDEKAAGSGGAGAGGAAGGGAGAGAAGGDGGAGGAGAGAGSGGGAGAGAGGGAGAGAGANDQGWWRKPEMGFDADTTKFLDGKNYPDMKTALSSARSADEMVRARNVMNKPDPKNIAGWDGFAELGWNPDKTKYEVNKPKLSDGDAFDEKAFNTIVGAAHEAKLAPWQAEAITNSLHKYATDGVKSFRDAGAAANRELDNKLRSGWGDKYEANVELSKRAFAAFKPDGVSGAQMDQVMGSPAMVELFHRIGEAMGEDRLVTGDRSSGFGGKSPADARAERLKFENDPNWMKIFNDPRHPQNKDYVAQRQALIEIEARK